MSLRRTFHTAWTSYAGVASALVAGLITLRLATGGLSKEEFGLWSFTMQSIGYFLLLDFGVSASLGRLFAEPLASGNQRTINGWFTMGVGVLVFQAMLILALGLLLRDWVIHWFGIPGPLRVEASVLWTAMLVIQAMSLPMRITGAILFAQNRAYWGNLFPVFNAWVGLGIFALMLSAGFGVISYAWSAASGVLLGGIVSALAVWKGPHRFAFTLNGLQWKSFRELFSFASAVFFISIAVQVGFASQTLIITKILGLAAGAVYAVTSRVPMLIMQLIWKPFDSFTPRWQTEHCAGGSERVHKEAAILFRASILLAGIAAIGIIVFNPVFVHFWTRPEYFGGHALNILLAVFVFVQTLTHCLSYGFSLHKRMRLYSFVVIGTTALAIGAMILAVKGVGLPGIPLGLLVADLIFSLWFHLVVGSRLLGIPVWSVLAREGGWILPLALLGGWVATGPLSAVDLPPLTAISVSGGVATMLILPLVWRIWRLVAVLRPACA